MRTETSSKEEESTKMIRNFLHFNNPSIVPLILSNYEDNTIDLSPISAPIKRKQPTIESSTEEVKKNPMTS